MQIDIEAYRGRLQQIEAEVLQSLDRAENEVHEAQIAEVEDSVDRANSGENKDAALDRGSRNFDRLREVREALERIDAGTFGKCVDCGRDIQPRRLDAAPWTPYCIEDQKRHEPATPSSTM